MCMITGDAEDTAVAVASAIGFFDPSQHRTLSGAGIEHMSPSELEVWGVGWGDVGWGGGVGGHRTKAA